MREREWEKERKREREREREWERELVVSCETVYLGDFVVYQLFSLSSSISPHTHTHKIILTIGWLDLIVGNNISDERRLVYWQFSDKACQNTVLPICSETKLL